MGWVSFPYILIWMHVSINYLCVKVGNCCMYNKWMRLRGNFTHNWIYLVSLGPFHWRLFSKKAALPREVQRTVEFAGKLLLTRSRKQRDVCWPLIGRKNIFCAQSEASIRISRGTGLLRVASQGLSHQFLKTFTAVFPDPTDRPLVSEDGMRAVPYF